MEIPLESEPWDANKYLADTANGTWGPMYDAGGNVLAGVEGMKCVSAVTADGTKIGLDLVRMKPGSAFEPHEHVGDHMICFSSGRGSVQMNDRVIPVHAGSSIYIPGRFAHAVRAAADEPLEFTVFGHHHSEIDARDRALHPHRHP